MTLSKNTSAIKSHSPLCPISGYPILSFSCQSSTQLRITKSPNFKIFFPTLARNSYVLLTALLSALFSTVHIQTVASLRGIADVTYPNAYAPANESDPSQNLNKYLFNCGQRAHVNYLEHLPMFLVGLGISGIEYPRVSAALGGVWIVGRWVYLRGYMDRTQIRGRGRYRGFALFMGPEVGLLGLAGWVVGRMVLF